MTRWGMVIDLRKCIGCESCATMCKVTNHLPPNHWRQVIDCGIGGPPERQRQFLHISCVHCSEPPCLEVCPTTATYRRPDGIVDVNYDLCIGCGYCIVACPFLARTIIFHNEAGFHAGPKSREVTDQNADTIGVCTKCDFCQSRIELGMESGLTPGLDTEATPACVVTCSVNALHFGDLDDPDSMVSRLVRDNPTARLQEALGTDPSVYYIVG